MIAADVIKHGSLPRDGAERLLAACKAEFAFLKTYDSETLALDPDPAKVARGDQLRAAWLRWADEAEPIYERLVADGSLDATELRLFLSDIRHARYLATRDRAELRRRLERAEAGEYITGEEARRELGLSRRR